MQTLLIQFEMKSPVIPGGYNGPPFPLMFDSLLAWMAAVRKWGPNINDRPQEIFEEIEIPVEETGEKMRYYQASACELYPPEKVRIGRHFWVKSTNWLDKTARELKESKPGELQRFESVTYIFAPYVNFYVNGSRREIERLLLENRDCLSLGAHRTVGWGKVKRINIGELDKSYSFLPLWDVNGKPARPIPVEELPSEKTAVCPVVLMPYRPPYWLRKNMVPCVLPPPERWWIGISDFCLDKFEDELWQKEQLLNEAESKLRK